MQKGQLIEANCFPQCGHIERDLHASNQLLHLPQNQKSPIGGAVLQDGQEYSPSRRLATRRGSLDCLPFPLLALIIHIIIPITIAGPIKGAMAPRMGRIMNVTTTEPATPPISHPIIFPMTIKILIFTLILFQNPLFKWIRLFCQIPAALTQQQISGERPMMPAG